MDCFLNEHIKESNQITILKVNIIKLKLLYNKPLWKVWGKPSILNCGVSEVTELMYQS